MVSTFTPSIAALVYLMAVFYLSWYGYKRSREVEDFMVAGRRAHSFVVALPISLVVAFAVSLFTKPMDGLHVAECFKGIKG